MVRRTIVLGSIALIALGCAKKEAPKTVHVTGTLSVPQNLGNAKIAEPVQPFDASTIDAAVLGDELAPDGTVVKENDTIPEGHAPHVTMKLRESPSGLQTRVVWKDTFGREVETDERAMGGLKVVTFTCTKKLKVGRYSVVGYWGGNVAAEKSFEVVAPRKKK